MVKINLRKVYDTLDWNFLESILKDFGFPQGFIDIVIFSVRESTISIVWNGEKLPPIYLGYGLRQGDLLAQYLFILAMERLSWDI